MPHIQQLDTHVSDLIAAGEVVERPASVVKELVENAIDAGSSVIVVELQRGGMGLIRVTDNGCGIAAEELPTAFLRHATSKLRRPEDLTRIGTLGFRGEALAAIAAVSRLDVLSRRTGADSGAALHLEGGIPEEVTAAGAPEGTTILVRDLFYNTPARLKFMRKDSAETAAALGLVQHLVLSHPEISFQFIKDGAEALHTPGDGKMESAVYAALGREFALSLLPVEGSGGELTVQGYVTKPLCGRGSRGMQTFFVNGRFIKSQLLTAALEEGYRNQMMKGKFPGCVLYIDMPVTAVDVNVHPAKTQVKFAREHDVFDAVFHTVLDTLGAAGKPELRAAPGPAEQVRNPRGDFFVTMDAKTYRQTGGRPEPARPDRAAQGIRPAAPNREQPPQAAPAEEVPARPRMGWNTEMGGRALARDVAEAFPPGPARSAGDGPGPAFVIRPAKPPRPDGDTAAPAMQAAEVPEAPEPVQEALELPREAVTASLEETPWRIAGEVLRTYIVCEDESQNVWLIDKHAAHERVLFDRLKARTEPLMRQGLVSPVAAALSREDGAILLENLDLLEEFGFLCEDFGDDTVLVREVPSDIDAADVQATLEAFAEDLRTGRDPAERRDSLLHTMACKAAIKAGMVSSEAELRVLVNRVQAGEIQYCPHGRPVAARIRKYDLEKLFKRA